MGADMGIYENFKEVVSIVQKLDNIELYRKILDLQGEAQRLMSETLRKDDEIRQLHARIDELEEVVRFKAKLVEINGFYFELDQSGIPNGHPFCPKCWEVNRTPVHIHQMGHLLQERTKSVCPNCKSTFKFVAQRKPQST
jgi:ribosomal protein S27AE